MRQFISLIVLVVCSLGIQAFAAQPNIVFILTDDQGWPTLGCYGGKHVATPHLDRLAGGGVKFTDAYVMPQCTPTRAALLTGQQAARNGMWHVISWYGYPWARVREPLFVENLPRSAFTVAKGLKKAGYRTACIGKWHLTSGADGNYMSLKREGAKHFGFDFAPPPPPKEDFAAGGDRGARYLTDQALKFIERKSDKPFFVFLSHHMIHGVVVAPEELKAKYRQRGYPETGLQNVTYLAALETIDRSVGRLMKRLEELKMADNTLVVFLSDNGGIDWRFNPKTTRTPSDPPHRLEVDKQEYDNAPLRAGKGSMYEGGIRVPAIVHWPAKVRGGRTVSAPIHVVDWLPTLLDAAGAKRPDDVQLDGESLLPLLTGEGDLPERALYWYLPLYDIRWGLTPCAVIRRGDWKLIEFFGDYIDEQRRHHLGHRLELYNLKDDIGETTNLAKQKPELAAKLRAELRGWIKSVPAEIPEQNPHFDPRRALLETRDKPDFLLKNE